MLLTFPTFMIGAPLQELVCTRLTDLNELEKVGKDAIRSRFCNVDMTRFVSVVTFLK